MDIKVNEAEDTRNIISCEIDGRKNELEKTKYELKSLKSNFDT